MCKEKHTVHYCTILSEEQWAFLLGGRHPSVRLECLHGLMTAAVRTRAACSMKGTEIVLETGQAAVSEVELARRIGCNRKTVGKIVDSFNRLGMLTTKANNRTSVHTLHFLTGWYVDGVLLANPYYAKPSAVAKARKTQMWTPATGDKGKESGQHTKPPSEVGETPKMGSIRQDAESASSSLKFGARQYIKNDGNGNNRPRQPTPQGKGITPGTSDSGDKPPSESGNEAHPEAVDGTDGGAAGDE